MTLITLLDFASSRPDQKRELALMSNAESDNLPGLHDTDPSKRNSGKGTPATDSRESSTDLLDEDAGYPPADHGWRAWLFLAGSFWLEGFVWGETICSPSTASNAYNVESSTSLLVWRLRKLLFPASDFQRPKVHCCCWNHHIGQSTACL